MTTTDAAAADRAAPRAHVAVRVVDASHDDPRAWDALAVRSARGEALQSHAWGELKRLTGWQPHRYHIEDASGPVAVVSLQEQPVARPMVRRLPGPLGRSTLLATAAGRFLYAPTGPVLLRDDAGAAVAALAGLRRIARARRAALLLVDPNWPEGSDEASALAVGGFRPAQRQIQVSRIAMIAPLEEDETSQKRHLADGVYRNVNRARRKGVTVERIGAGDPAAKQQSALRSLAEMVEQTGRRKGFRVREADYIVASGSALVAADCASVWLARHEGRDVSATLLHHSGRRVGSFMAATPDIAGRNRVDANYLVQWEIMRWAAGAGFREYDLGGADTQALPGIPQDESHPLWTLYRFKLQWGARPVVYARAHDYAPRQSLGLLLNTAWRAADGVQRARRGGDRA